MGDSSDSNNSSDLDRSAERTNSLRRSIGPGDDDYDYDLQALCVSDGFRPVEVAQNQTTPCATSLSISSLERSVPRPVSPRPSSITKPYPAHETFPHEGSGQAPATSSNVPSDFPTMAAETPYNGPSGPSHPYQMYPQDVRLARATSSATTSAESISRRSYDGPRHPTHPYGIYPQNVASVDDGPSNHPPQRDINVGFPGTADRYQRRLGPDGEEVADMIGPDGHTEQLPPYTRYPEEDYSQKAVGVDTAQPPQQQLEIPGAGGIGLATRNPEFASTEDLNRANSPQSRRSVRSFRSEASHHSINTAPLVLTNEKSARNWKEAAKRKVWGIIPCWAVVLGVIFMILLGVVVGTVIGIHLDQGSSHDKSSGSGSGPGYVPLPTVPAGLPPLPKGSYSLPLSHPRYSNKCIKYPSQSEAWNCHASMSELVMTISGQQDSAENEAYALDFTYDNALSEDSFVYSYGVQPPALIPQQLKLVKDTFETSLGAAWAFMLHYNKTIILPESYLTTNNDTFLDGMQRRMNLDGLKRKGLAESGSRPWVCTWPGTILEVFIYAGQNGSTFNDVVASSGSKNTPPGNELFYENRRDVGGPQYGHSSRQDNDFPFTTPPSSPTTPTPTHLKSSRTTDSLEIPDYFSPAPVQSSQYPPYPKVVKFEERRDPDIDAPPPVCRQVQIVANGVEAVPVLSKAGFPIEIQIVESTPEDEEKQETGPFLSRRRSVHNRRSTRRNADSSDASELGDCGCIWWLL
ncbi:hypothetical protein GGS21DRAFT_138725 [Xylaria nigripes]|nr:hypothetical protein GGS21DRAFT_138725 [Xylaria nigripes]